MNTTESLKKYIANLVKQYADLQYVEQEFEPGEDVVPPSGRIIGATELQYMADESYYLKLDCSKVKMRMKWQSRWTLEVTLAKIVRWHKSWIAGENMHELTLSEIKIYISSEKYAM